MEERQGSPVVKLQLDAAESSTSVASILREAKTVAARLGVKPVPDWFDLELKGYPSMEGLPAYRHVRARIMFLNPMAGWIPLHFERADLQDAVSNQYAFEGIGVIEGLVARVASEGGSIGRPLPHEVESFIRNQMPVKTQLQSHIDISAFQAILDAVRNAVLDWSLSLPGGEVAGVSGTLSKEQLQDVAEKSISYQANVIHVTNVENVSSNASVNVVQGGKMTAVQRQDIADNVALIQNQLRELPEEEREEVTEQLEVLDEETKFASPRKARLIAALKAIGRVSSSLVGSAAKTAIEAAVKAGIKTLAGA